MSSSNETCLENVFIFQTRICSLSNVYQPFLIRTSEVAASPAAAPSFFVDAEGNNTFDSLETVAFRSCKFVEAITSEYDGGSSTFSSPDRSIVIAT